MALSARELLLIVRAQNYASGALRRVSRDVGQMGRTRRDVQLRTRQLENNVANARATRQLVLNELQSVSVGKRRIDAQNAVNRAKNAEVQAWTRHESIVDRVNRTQDQINRKQNELNRMTRVMNVQASRAQTARGLETAARAAGGAPIRRGMSLRESAQEILNTRKEIENLNASMVTQEQSLRNAAAALPAYTSGLRKAESAVVELDAREAYLTNQRLPAVSRAVQNSIGVLENFRENVKKIPWENFGTGARIVEHAGRVLQLFGLAAVAAVGYAAHSFAQLQTQAGLAATQSSNTLRGIAADTQRFSNIVIRELGKSTASMEDMTKSIYDIF